MSIEHYNDKILREYLLGLLPEAETERLDELSVTEEEFAQSLRIAEQDLIDAYVNGELTERELLQFPKQYLRSPNDLARVEFAQAFQLINSTRVQSEGTKTNDFEDRSSASTVSLFNFGNWISWKWGLVAASLLLFLASLFIVQQLRERRRQTVPQTAGENRQDPRLTEQPRPASAGAKSEEPPVTQSLNQPSTQPTNRPSPSRFVSFVLKPQMRSVSQPAELTIPNDITSVGFTLQLEPSDTNYYRTILLEASSDRTVWQGGKVKATTTDGLSVIQIRVPAGLLKRQAYKIRTVGLYPNGTTETTNEYSFRVVK